MKERAFLLYTQPSIFSPQHPSPPHCWRGDPHQEKAKALLAGKNNQSDSSLFTKNFKITPYQEKARYKVGGN